jgi:hypothetical protein
VTFVAFLLGLPQGEGAGAAAGAGLPRQAGVREGVWWGGGGDERVVRLGESRTPGRDRGGEGEGGIVSYAHLFVSHRHTQRPPP